jgi:hypothetical protein
MSELETLTSEQLVESVEFWRTCYHRRGDQIMALEDELEATVDQIGALEDRIRVAELKARAIGRYKAELERRSQWRVWFRRPVGSDG